MPLLETRRIYAAGRSLAITLPRGWLAYFGPKAGDEVEIVANGKLTINPKPRVAPEIRMGVHPDRAMDELEGDMDKITDVCRALERATTATATHASRGARADFVQR